MKIGQRLTELREKKGLTQDQMAEVLGIKRARYNSWENNIAKPDIDFIDKLADFHKVSSDSILGRNHITESNLPSWATSKDKRDFKKMLQEDLPVMFDGVPIEGESRQRVLDVLTGLFWEAKEMNKKTYGRKKDIKTNTTEDDKE
ncbi:helix-turn-helix domain-containing protein [Paenibacillus sp. MAH-36]|uniref:Helix-turn-helix domain-containing protein n=1 Tax=Paenibacillus violae TaxID=3077234 RepID=A0ABU3R788_9BACL|nr:helix-turn-helix domain-containing protein [Paenibacillus sp. PFR10]MDU0200135.1 helix-turn-helix domain-containing protein [Paenibacillus sp. PFR10]